MLLKIIHKYKFSLSVTTSNSILSLSDNDKIITIEKIKNTIKVKGTPPPFDQYYFENQRWDRPHNDFAHRTPQRSKGIG